MAEKTPQLKSCPTCSMCTEIVEDPVSLGCNHSFCTSCLQDFWVQAGKENCPICKKERKSSKDIIENFVIKELRSAPSDEAQGVIPESSQRSAPSDEAQGVIPEPSQRSAPSDEAQGVRTEPSQRSAPSDEAQVVRTEPSQRSAPSDESLCALM